MKHWWECDINKKKVKSFPVFFFKVLSPSSANINHNGYLIASLLPSFLPLLADKKGSEASQAKQENRVVGTVEATHKRHLSICHGSAA